MRKVFIVKQTEFCPEIYPVIGFFRDGDRKHLLRNYSPDDLIFVIITKRSEEDTENRGCILGIASFYPEEVNGEDFIDKNNPRFSYYYKVVRGRRKHKWPHAVKLKNAWKFSNPHIAEQVISEKISKAANWRALKLSEKETRAMLKLFEDDAKEEILMDGKVNNVEDSLAENVGDKKDTHAKGPTLGPPPTEGEVSVSYKRDFKGPAYIYVSRFSDSDIWKIGWTKDVANRLKSLNDHVPYELLQQEWRQYRRRKYDNGKIAYEAEQALLKLLKDKRTRGERAQCTEQELKHAWKKLKQMY